MAYNKSKHIEAAQKHLSQGKLPQAIAEYQQVLKHEPNDQIILMTVGDLFVRKGETFQAIEYFERLAQVFTRDGFLTKAIAIYKKIAKLAPEETKPLEKLADLYVQQGILSEARPIFLQLAEAHLKANRREPAATLLRKLLEAEPDNLRVQMRLAEIQQAMGQTADAAQTFINCAERQIANQQAGEAVKLCDKALQLVPDNTLAKVTKAKAYAGDGHGLEATSLLEQLPETETTEELTSLLIELYLEQRRGEEAVGFARKIFVRDAARYKHAHHVTEALLDTGDTERALQLLDVIRSAMATNGAHEVLAKTLIKAAAATQMQGRLEPHEWLIELYTQMDDQVHLPGALQQLGQAAAASGNLEKARAAYERLLALMPNDETVRKNLDQVRAQLSLPPSEIERPEPPKETPSDEVEAAEPAYAETPLDEDTQKFVTLSLTDVDLFSSYGMTQKAIDLLEKVILRAPRHTQALEKLLDLYLGEGNSERTAELAGTLAELYTERDDHQHAEKFQELARRFQRATPGQAETPAPKAAAAAPAPAPAPQEFELPQPAPVTAEEIELLNEAEEAAELDKVAAAEPAEEKPAPKKATAPTAAKKQTEPGPEQVEIDLSDEWAEISEQVAEEPAHASVESNASPFDLGDMVIEEAARAEAEAEAAEAQEVAEVAASDPNAMDLMLEALSESGISEQTMEAHSAPVMAPAAQTVIPMPVASASSAPAKSADADLEYELELVETSPRKLEPPRAAPKESGNGLHDLRAAVEEAIAAPPTMPSAPVREEPRRREDPALAAAATTPLRGASDPGGPLNEIFQEFREQLDELQTDEDPETHYNLGIAYREMGLLEEAISEFQKVAQAGDRGRQFKYTMQCCTLLGLTFMEKGQPEIAAFWYERALQTQGLDVESILALRYDLGLAQELAGQADAALKSYQQVYAVNIDYRDVGERIASLRKQ
jgi:pilus assembly protein FimV